MHQRYVDTHIHLADEAYKGKVDEILREAWEVGVLTVIANSEDFESCIQTLRLAEEYSWRVLPALGIHPWVAPEVGENEAERVVQLILDNRGRLAAVGEVGLDSGYTRGDREAWERQLKIFRVMLEAAEQAKLPVIVHSRRSVGEVFAELEAYDLRKVVFHWFSGSLGQLKQILERGYAITVGPSICYSKHVRRLVAETPLEALMAETDGPVKFKGLFEDGATPSAIPLVVEKIAEVKGLSLEETAAEIFSTCKKFFIKVAEAERRLL